MLGGVLAAVALVVLMGGSTLFWGPSPSRARVLVSLLGAIAAVVVSWIVINALTPITGSTMTVLSVLLVVIAAVLARAGRAREHQVAP